MELTKAEYSKEKTILLKERIIKKGKHYDRRKILE